MLKITGILSILILFFATTSASSQLAPHKAVPRMDSMLQTAIPSREQVVGSYLETKAKIRERHHAYATMFKAQTTHEGKKQVQLDAKTFLVQSMLIDIVPAWCGTPWTFNGYTNFPRSRSIACGWFVQRVLEHLDFKLERKNTKLPYFAQNWPKTMIEGIDHDSWTFDCNGSGSDAMDLHLEDVPEGIYLLGFANNENQPGSHVGFLVNTERGPYIIHSLSQVERLPASEVDYYHYYPFFYLGNLLNERVLSAWLNDTPLSW